MSLVLYSPLNVNAFTQYSLGIFPMGHEWITRVSIYDLIKGDPLDNYGIRGADPRKNFPSSWLAKNTRFSGAYAQKLKGRKASIPVGSINYQAKYDFIRSAIVGVRWVDLAGVNVAKAKWPVPHINPFDVVAQEGSDVQYDHFMRAFDDLGSKGGYHAARKAQERFIEQFVRAAMADDSKRILVWDGGLASRVEEVDYNYFLFGRASHLFQDSFSPEHTVRIEKDGYRTVKQVNSYICNKGSEQHSHKVKDIILTSKSGDVIWKSGVENFTKGKLNWKDYQLKSMKTIALVATEANEDLWAAFMRTMDTPRAKREYKAKEEARKLVKNWLSINQEEAEKWYRYNENRNKNYVLAQGESGKGLTEKACMTKVLETKVSRDEKISKINEDRRIAVYNMKAVHGYGDSYDPYLRIPYLWRWLDNKKYKQPGSSYKIPTKDEIIKNKEQPIRKIQLVNTRTKATLGALKGSDLGPTERRYTYCKKSVKLPPLYKTWDVHRVTFELIGDNNDFYLRMAGRPSIFLTYEGFCSADVRNSMFLFNIEAILNIGAVTNLDLTKLSYPKFQLVNYQGDTKLIKCLTCPGNYLWAPKVPSKVLPQVKNQIVISTETKPTIDQRLWKIRKVK